jgi:hypothetical protein
MASNAIHVSDELLAELQAKTQAEGRTVDELAELDDFPATRRRMCRKSSGTVVGSMRKGAE